jgi:DNA topoisomerase-3
MIIEGKKAYGCANYQSGCNFVLPYIMMGKKLTPKQIVDLIEKGKTTIIKGFSQHDSDLKKNGKLVLTSDFNVEFEEV